MNNTRWGTLVVVAGLAVFALNGYAMTSSGGAQIMAAVGAALASGPVRSTHPTHPPEPTVASTTSLGTCKYGHTYDDGCASAPTDGNYDNSNFFSYAKQSGQGSYHASGGAVSTHPPPWNVAGVDYPVGYSLSDAGGSLKDPASATLPSGCSYSSTGSVLGGGKVTCNGSGALVLNGWDFSLHNCIPLLINTAPSSVTITNSKFQMGSNCSQVQGTITGSISGTTLTMTALVSGAAPGVNQHIQSTNPNNLINTSGPTISGVTHAWDGVTGTYSISSSCTTSCGSQNFYVGQVQGYMIAVVNPSSAPFDFEQNYVNGDEPNYPLDEFACLWINGTSGSWTFKYDAILNCGRPLSSNSYGATLFAYNYVDTFARSVSDGHGEIDIHGWQNQTSPSAIYSFNTVVQGSGAVAYGSTTVFYPTGINGGTSSAITLVQADHNTNAINKNSGTVTTAAAVAEIDQTTAYGTCVWDTNYFDNTGALFDFGNASSGGAVCSGGSTFTGNINMLSGNSAASTYNTKSN